LSTSIKCHYYQQPTSHPHPHPDPTRTHTYKSPGNRKHDF
jgi:hypothetical protein